MILVIKIGEKKGEIGIFKEKLLLSKKFKIDKTLSSKILEKIEKILKNKKIKIQDLKGIILSVNPNTFTPHLFSGFSKNIEHPKGAHQKKGAGFTSQRIGITTINTFFLAHKIPLFLIPKEVSLKEAFLKGKNKLSNNFLKPVYSKEPNITKPTQIFGLGAPRQKLKKSKNLGR